MTSYEDSSAHSAALMRCVRVMRQAVERADLGTGDGQRTWRVSDSWGGIGQGAQFDRHRLAELSTSVLCRRTAGRPALRDSGTRPSAAFRRSRKLSDDRASVPLAAIPRSCRSWLPGLGHKRAKPQRSKLVPAMPTKVSFRATRFKHCSARPGSERTFAVAS